MILKYLINSILLLLMLTSSVFSQDESLQATVDYKVNKMKTELNLSDSQADAIRPIVKDFLTKRDALLQEASGEGIVDHVSIKSTLKALKENEYHQLSKILSEDQMKEWINKENIMASLNPDSVESSVDDGVGLSPYGANFKF